MYVRDLNQPRLTLRLENWRWLISAGLGFIAGAAMMLLMLEGAAAQSAHTVDDNRLLVRPIAQTEEPGTEKLPVWAPAPLVASAVTLDVTGFVIRGTVEQIFKNPGESWVEGIYKFPLPDDAAVDALTLSVGGRVIEGVIEERAAARKSYETAVAAGQAASLLEQERPNLFTISVANIPPGEVVKVSLGYQAKARRDGDSFELTMPLVAAPRYLPPQPVAGNDHPALREIEDKLLKDRAAIGFPVTRDGPRNAAAFDIHLRAGAPLASLESPTHELSVVQESDGHLRIGMRRGIVPANRDFVLKWKTERGKAPGAALFKERIDGVDYLLFMMLPPDAETADQMASPRDVTFIVDTSSSMHGDAMDAAKAALAHALERLKPEDRFDVVAFDNTTERLFGIGHHALPGRVEAGLRFAASLQADGGTEMAPALTAALADRSSEEAVRQVVFLTDGLVGNEEQLFGLIERQLGPARLFTVGLGPAPNGWFMRKAAEVGRGRNIQIADLSKAKTELAAFYDGIAAPVATDLALGSEGAFLESFPKTLPDLYGREPVIAVMRIEDPAGLPVDHFALMGTTEGQMWTRHVAIDAATPGTGIAKLWARAKSDSILDNLRQGRLSEDEARLAVLDVALAHGITTRFTSLVAVEKTPTRPLEEDVISHEVPNDMPDGWTEANLTGPTPKAAMDSPTPSRMVAPAAQFQQASLVRIGGPAGAIGWAETLKLGLIVFAGGLLLFIAALGLKRREV